MNSTALFVGWNTLNTMSAGLLLEVSCFRSSDFEDDCASVAAVCDNAVLSILAD
jgi:hypothetical protein